MNEPIDIKFKMNSKELEEASQKVTNSILGINDVVEKVGTTFKVQHDTVQSLTQQINSLLGSEAIAWGNLNNDKINQQEQFNDEILKLEFENRLKRLSSLKDGVFKERDLINLKYDIEVARIDELEKKFKNAQNNKLDDRQKEVISSARNSAFVNKKASLIGVEVRQTNEYKDETKKNNPEYKKKLEEESQALNEFLKKYGDFQTKKLVITETSNKKINAAQSPQGNEVANKEMFANLAGLGLADFKQSFQWDNVMKDMTKQSTGSLENLIITTRTLMGQIGKELTIDDQDSLSKSIETMEKEIKGRNPFLGFANGFSDFNKARGEFPALLAELETAQKTFVETQGELAQQTKLVDEGKITKESDTYKNAFNKMLSAQSGVATATSNVNKNLNEQRDALKKISTAAKSSGAVLTSLGKDVKTLATVFDGDAGKAIGDVVNLFDTVVKSSAGVIDSLGEMTKSTVSKIGTVADASSTGIGTTSKAASAAIRAVETASVILAIISAAIQVVMALFAIFGKAKEVSKATLDEYKAFMEVTKELIKQQKELMKTISGVELAMANEKGKRIIEQQIEVTRKLGKEYLKSGSSWKSRSKGYNTNKMLDKNRDEILNPEFKNLNADSLFDLSGEKLKQFKEENYLIWAKLDDDTRKYLNTIIDCEKEIDNLAEATREAAMQMKFDELSGELNKLLLNVDTTAENVADSFETMMQKAIVKLVQNGSYITRLKQWYEKVSAIFTAKDMTEEQKKAAIAEAKEEYINIHKDAKEDRDLLAKEFGIDFSPTKDDSDSKQKVGGFQTMSQDTGTELLGQFTAIRIHSANIDKLMDEMKSEDKLVTNQLAAIEKNTFNTVNELKEVNNKLKQIKVEGIKVL